MRKKIFLLILIYIMCFLFVDYAQAYTCSYNYSVQTTSGASNGTIKIYIDEEKKEITSEGGFLDYDDYLLDPLLDSSWTSQKLIDEYIKGVCPEYIYGCKVKEDRYNAKGDGPTTETTYFPLINQNLVDKIPTDNNKLILDNTTKNGTGAKYYIIANQECIGANINKDQSDKEQGSLNIPCVKYDNLYKELKQYACTDIDDLSTCSLEKVTDKNGYKSHRNKLKNYCDSKLRNSIYQDPCVKGCVKLSKDLAAIEGREPEDFKCGFSEKLILWIANIVKWAKYIIPVIVMVLGILDFIKAISSEKDDEMKKAQSGFIKRLIACALIFIIPFIIEFVLNKMGFAANGCGIIDL